MNLLFSHDSVDLLAKAFSRYWKLLLMTFTSFCCGRPLHNTLRFNAFACFALIDKMQISDIC